MLLKYRKQINRSNINSCVENLYVTSDDRRIYTSKLLLNNFDLRFNNPSLVHNHLMGTKSYLALNTSTQIFFWFYLNVPIILIPPRFVGDFSVKPKSGFKGIYLIS